MSKLAYRIEIHVRAPGASTGDVYQHCGRHSEASTAKRAYDRAKLMLGGPVHEVRLWVAEKCVATATADGERTDFDVIA